MGQRRRLGQRSIDAGPHERAGAADDLARSFDRCGLPGEDERASAGHQLARGLGGSRLAGEEERPRCRRQSVIIQDELAGDVVEIAIVADDEGVDLQEDRRRRGIGREVIAEIEERLSACR
jgi:GNAT superfamily N-acetyltransferase